MRSFSTAIIISGLFGMLTLTACHAQEAPSAGTAVTVNGEPISQQMIDDILHARAAQGQPVSADVTKMVKEHLIESKLLSDAAVAKGLDKSAEVSDEIELSRETILARAYIADYLKSHPVTDDAMKAEYNKLKGNVSGQEYKVQHILVKSEKQAKQLIAKLKKGASFDKLAKQYSMDPGSKANGGSLDWVTPNSLVKPFSDAMVKLQKGQYTAAPVQTPYGWHIIKLDDVRPLKAPPFDDVKPQLAQRLQQQEIVQAINDLKAHATIVDNSK